jgi:hypothetical protein
MKTRYFYTLLIALILCGCKQKKHELVQENDYNKVVTIQEVIDWANRDTLTEKEAQHFDSLNEHDALLICNAERELDTIVNHYHLHFITDER